MRVLFCLLACLFCAPQHLRAEPSGSEKVVYVIPVRDNIEDTMVYLIRRGLKEAVEHHAQAIVLDMNTNGGRVDKTEEIMELLENFHGETITFVNKKAYSAGAFIAVSTEHIYMTPSSVIGAAAPIMATPEGGAQDIPSIMHKKISSALAARIRAAAQRHGHNPEVVESMVKETEGLSIDGKEIVKKGEILTLTDLEATTTYGKPPKPLLAEGVCKTLDEVLAKAGFQDAVVHTIEPMGAEVLSRWITSLAPLLLLVGLAGIYIEFKTPGVILPGVVGAVALLIFFFGHYVAGLAGAEQLILFIIGLILIGVELFLLPGHMLPGLLGALAVLGSLLWTMIDKFPGAPISLPTMPQLEIPLAKLTLSLVGAAMLVALLVRWLPHSSGPYSRLILKTELDSAQGYNTATTRTELVGKRGVSITILRPSGTARFDDEAVDVISEGGFIHENQAVVVKEVHGAQVIVRKA